ncbi:hypothetical protein [Bradyrhizobium diazoefficiens]|uniref:Uncharacterized protein n=1 Tax=Bradyrhizobium diazoefficiens TaxID=1355477 RepID=A0A809YII5_9BRAD|nr:hypothetical protein [Bradyrhizobium diazoefficiens]BCA04178.1 hypothetical protein H12S4_50820 [Bradyrhizobium diazoefficiens]BCA21535.1 hypothetical protein BDHH15_47500 [Bradyrhizobium diazoefficiens]BCE39704.1 hypothetical protein XF3B_47350 [Bradyrhizobium diazoefficiens]BCF53100.1 hypothetical protein XF17B_47380 [Bradyrhizobium diazoefficiens]
MTRLSADPKSPEHWTLTFESDLKVRLGGFELSCVMYADDELGFVELFMSHPDGSPMLCACREQAMTRLQFGTVDFVGTRR